MAGSENFQGAALMSGAMVAFAVNDTFMKLIGEHLPLFQAVFLRGLATVLVLLVIVQRMGQLRVRLAPRDAWLVVIRSGAEVMAAYFYLTALFNMPLAIATAILQLIPLSITLAAALFLKEPVGWRRASAIIAGFIGMALIVKPGSEGFNSYAFYALASVLCVTVRDLAARKMSRDVPSVLVAFATALGVTLAAGAASVTIDWAPVTMQLWTWLGAATACVVIGYVLSVSAMRLGDVGSIAPFRYVSVLAALALGVAVWGDMPDRWELLGTAIIVGAGVFTLLRNRRTMPRETGLRPR